MSAALLVAGGVVCAMCVAFSLWTLRGGGMPKQRPRYRRRLGQRIRRARTRRWRWRLRGYLRARGRR